MSIQGVRFAFGKEVCEREGRVFSMKSRLQLSLAVVASVCLVITVPVRARSDSEQIGVSVGRLLEEGHYTHQQPVSYTHLTLPTKA